MEVLAHRRLDVPLKRRRVAAARDAAECRRASTSAYYDEHAEEYAAATIDLDVSERIARFAGMLRPGARVLDAGCGAGRDLVGLSAAGLAPVGLDASERLAAIARRVSGTPVIVGDILSAPFEPESFDGIWAMASLLHLERRDTTAAASALARLLAPGGLLFASVKRGEGQVSDEAGRWFTLHDEPGWKGHLRSAGLDVIEIIGEPPGSDGAVGSVRPGWISSFARRPA